MNDGGSTLGGNQTGSGGTDALNSADLKISHDDTPSSPATSTSTSTSTSDTSSSDISTISSTTPSPNTTSTASASGSSSPFPGEGILTAADSLEISSENLTEEPNPASDTLSISHDDSTNNSSDTTVSNPGNPDDEHVPILPPSSGPARLFGQDISGITDEDLSSSATAQPIPTTIFPGSTSTPETTSAPDTTTQSTDPTFNGVYTAQTEATTAPEQTDTAQNMVAAPADPATIPTAPAAPAQPAVPYEQEFLASLHPDTTPKTKDTGDIILDPDASKRKTRKYLIIAIVISIIIIFVLSLLAISSLSRNPSTHSNPNPRSQTQQALEAYGTTLAEWDQDSIESTTALKNAYNTFYEQAKNDSAYEGVLNNLESYSVGLEIVEYFANAEDLTTEEVKDMYIHDGHDETISEIQQIYDVENSPEIVQPYIEAVLNFYSTLINQYANYEYYGCFDQGDLDMQCAFAVDGMNPDLASENDTGYSNYLSATSEKQKIYSEIANSYDTIKRMVGGNEE